MLPPVQLIELLLAIDADRSNHNIPIFPPNIPDAIKHLQVARQAYPHMYAHPYYYTHPPPSSKTIPIHPSQAGKQPQWPTNPQKVKQEADTSRASKAPAQQVTPPHPASSSQAQSSASASAALARATATASETRTADDLPSYEEMIVEAITEMNELDGTPPKVLFAWMAAYDYLTGFLFYAHC